jgi:hypothetical protein
MSSASSRGHLLLLCRVLSDNQSTRATAIAELSGSQSAAEIVSLAEAESILPALYEAIAASPECLPRPDRTALALAHEANRRRNRLIHDAVVEIAAAANRHSTAIVALKGARWIMEDRAGFAAWRSMLDVDVLVRVEDYDAMRSILEQVGYRATRREQNFLGQHRFAGHYHQVALRRDRQPFVTEVHRHVEWQPVLLPTEAIFESSYVVAPGLRLPRPWHAALHAIIHWQIHHYGYQLGFHRVTDGLDISKFLGRSDVDWAAAAAHVKQAGIEREFDAAIAAVAEFFGARTPPDFRVSQRARNYATKALRPRESRLTAWQAKQHQRIVRLWHDHRFVYRSNLRKAGPVATNIGLWALRARRIPFLISHLASIALLQAAIFVRRTLRLR